MGTVETPRCCPRWFEEVSGKPEATITMWKYPGRLSLKHGMYEYCEFVVVTCGCKPTEEHVRRSFEYQRVHGGIEKNG